MALSQMLDPQAAGRQRTGMVVSILAHAVVLALCYFFVRWSPPDPPLPDYGVQLNFGVDAEGFGDIQSMAAANESPNTDASPGPPQPNEPTPQPQATPPVTKAETPDEITSDNIQEEDSPVEVPPTPVKRQPEPLKEPIREEPKPEPKPTKPSIPAPPAYSSNSKPGGGGTGTGPGTAGNNNGDRPGKVGDQGDRRGTLEGKALYGNPGNGTGASLDLAGWNWDSRPDKADPFDEEGKIVFEVKVDDEGNLVSVRPLEKTVSPKVVQFYQNQIENLTFSKTRDNASPAPHSSGRITLIIRSR